MKFNMSDSLQDKGAKILEEVYKNINSAASSYDEEFYLNRYLFQRLRINEDKDKKEIKKQLYTKNPKCHYCGEPFATDKGVHIHRKNSERGYHKRNCVLVHKGCHNAQEKADKKKISGNARLRSASGKHKSIRHLVEELLIQDPDITSAQMRKAVLEEFPTSAFKKTHYNYYKNKILLNGEFKYM